MENKPLQEEEISSSNIGRRTFFSFLIFGIANAVGVMGWRLLNKQPDDKGIAKPLRVVLDANEKVNDQFYSNQHLATEFPKSKATATMRVNGDIGIDKRLQPFQWRLKVNRHPVNRTVESELNLKMQDIRRLPKREMIIDFKCIEGWSMVSHWGGTRFLDFMKHYRLGTRDGKAPDPGHPENLYKYVGLITPDSKYYVGIDMKSMLHPQTILSYELNQKPLSILHGYPLRLIIPVKYGIKSLKCIGSIYFSDTRPPDYWYERGYDYDSAL